MLDFFYQKATTAVDNVTPAAQVALEACRLGLKLAIAAGPVIPIAGVNAGLAALQTLIEKVDVRV